MEKAIDSTAKTLASLAHGGKDQGPTRGFQTLIKLIGESKTKHEEDRIIRKESVFLKERVGGRDVTPRQMREYLIRLIYCEMLGIECSWGYIHAVKMTQSSNIMDKRIGYLAVSLFLNENHELNMLLVNTLQRDLKSSNMLEVSMALIIICKLIGSEMIPPLLPLVQDKLLHPKELVRKKAVMAMHHFYKVSPGTVSHLEDDFRRALSDQDPGVMEAALILIHDLAIDNPLRFKDLDSSFTSILSQVVSRKLPSDFDYHGVPAPWIQIRLLRILAVLGADDLKTSEVFYPAIEEVLGSAECTSNIGQAISYECIRTITSIYPNNRLIEKAAQTIVRFVTASNNNWKYLGINALGALVKINPKFAAEHQMVVIDCLDDPDETLKRKTLDLLFQMTNQSNVTVITERLISYLRQTTNEYIRSDLVGKITQLAERFAPDNQWFIQTMNAVFELGGSLVRREVAHNLMRLIAEGTDDDDTDVELRVDAVSSYLELLDKPHLPDILVKIICWVVGEYAYVQEDLDTADVLEKITALINRRFEEPDTHGWVVTAITKLVSHLGHMPESVQSQIALYLTSTDTDIQQRCCELVELAQDLTTMRAVLPLDASCEDLEIDSSLSFLDGFVSEALAKGASAYKPPHLRTPSPPGRNKPSASPTGPLKFEAYAAPTTSSYKLPTSQSAGSSPATPRFKRDTPPSSKAESLSVSSSTLLTPDTTSTETTDRNVYSYSPSESAIPTGVVRKWGREGYNKTTTLATISTSPQPEVARVEEVSEEQVDGGGDVGGDINTGATVAMSTVQASPLQPTQEEKKRSKLASQLFGGLTGPSRAPRAKSQPRTSTSMESGGGGGVRVSPQSQGRSARKSKEPEVDLLLDLQDIDFSQPAPATTTVHQPPVDQQPLSGGLLSNLQIRPGPPAPPSESVDLLGMLDGPSSSQPSLMDSHTTQPTYTPQSLIGNQPPPPVQSATSSASSLPAINTDAQNSVEPPQTAIPSSLIGDLSLLDSTALQTDASKEKGLLALTMYEKPLGSARVPSEYTEFPVAPEWESKDISQDANLRVSLTKVLKPDQLVLVLFLTNQKQADVTGVSLTIEKPSNTMAITGEGSTDLSLNTDIGGFGTVCHVVILTPSSPAINMSLRGQLSYKDKVTTQRRLFFDATIHVADMIRPSQISTRDFGKKWGSFTYEKKLKLQSSIKKPSEFMEVMKNTFNFYPVEIIGSEGICAGIFLPSTPCLVHGKISKSHLDFWVRTQSSLLTESIAKLAQYVFKST